MKNLPFYIARYYLRNAMIIKMLLFSLRVDSQPSSTTRHYDNLQTQEARTAADPTYEDPRFNSDSNQNAV